MLGVKKLDIYIIKSFLAYFFMTFFICMLILLMQFTWKHLSDLIGKGVGLDVLAEFFWYAALQTVPMALPLAILLAALMNFGNLGEHFELTAMKSAGISLFRIMRGLILFVSFLCVVAFFFSNNVYPKASVKLWTLILSLRQKSPELEIPEGEFYTGINGYNIFVKKKDAEKKMLMNMMIYDFSNGFNNATVTLADSGRVQFTADNKYLKLSMYDGESFENIKPQQSNNYNDHNIPYRRETFKTKEILIDFNTEFNRYDESVLKGHNISKNVVQLTHDLDSVSKIMKLRANEQAREMVSTQFIEARKFSQDGKDTLKKESNATTEILPKKYNVDSLFQSLPQPEMEQAVSMARQNAQFMKDKIAYNKVMLDDPTTYVRRHQIEWHQKFTLSFACLIFFFIGAPLGAIIRKGGLGFPVVISVILFVVYYIINTTGWKMAREGFWDAYQGMWLSSAVLFPLGLFLTWKAVTDASLFRTEAYTKMWDDFKLLLSKRKNNNKIRTTSQTVVDENNIFD